MVEELRRWSGLSAQAHAEGVCAERAGLQVGPEVEDHRRRATYQGSADRSRLPRRAGPRSQDVLGDDDAL
eukprot:2405276-Heterocapsa_arctica.AAC.1